MKLLILHDLNNPNREVPIDASDYSMASPLATGSAVLTKASGQPVLVHESPEEIARMIEELSS